LVKLSRAVYKTSRNIVQCMNSQNTSCLQHHSNRGKGIRSLWISDVPKRENLYHWLIARSPDGRWDKWSHNNILGTHFCCARRL